MMFQYVHTGKENYGYFGDHPSNLQNKQQTLLSTDCYVIVNVGRTFEMIFILQILLQDGL